jgi:alkylation response protein AidB-like acyl-CoA dehydrogenase
MSNTTVNAMEDAESFRLRASAWIRENLGPLRKEDITYHFESDEEELAAVSRDRALQRKIFDGGFAGICFPREYGGMGLTPAHQRVFNEELAGHEFPSRLTVPTFSPCAAVLLEYGTEAQKRRHIPAILKGEEIWCQFLSEPSGGSDVAGALTSAVKDGDDWVLNGSKVWTSNAWWGDWAICLARTNWQVSKHQGLTVFILPIHQPGIEIQRIERLNGSRESCQEFLTDVRVPDSDRIGELNEGWTITSRWMFHERVAHNSPYVTMPASYGRAEVGKQSPVRIAAELDRLDDPQARELIGEARILEIASRELLRRLAAADPLGRASEHSPAIGRLFTGMASVRQATISFEIAGPSASVWAEDDAIAGLGFQFLMRQATCIGGGTTEIARNVISERVLGMPREPSLDRNIAFRDVPRGPRQRTPSDES